MDGRRPASTLAPYGNSVERDRQSRRSAPNLVVLASCPEGQGLVCGGTEKTCDVAGYYRTGPCSVVDRPCPASRDRPVGHDLGNGPWAHAGNGNGTAGGLLSGYGCDDGGRRLDGQYGTSASHHGVDLGTSRTREHGISVGDAMALADPFGMALYVGGASPGAHHFTSGAVDPVGSAAMAISWGSPIKTRIKEVVMMERVPNPEEALLLEEAWAQLLNCAATLHELHDFVVMLADTMRQREPGLAHQPPVVEAIDQFLQQRQALRMTPQGFVVQGADRGFYAGLAETFGVRADAARILMDEPDGPMSPGFNNCGNGWLRGRYGRPWGPRWTY